MAKRRKYPAELKAKVALDALRGEQTMAELSARYNVHPNLIANWKKQAKESLVDVFNGGGAKRDAQHEAEIKEASEEDAMRAVLERLRPEDLGDYEM
mgnify:CR=1 FL=1